MRTTIKYFSFLLIFLFIASCTDRYVEVFTANSPVYMTYDDLRKAVKQSASRDLVNPGKIYFKDNYIFVVEEMKGIHIINASNPSSPQKTGFIEVPGCVDIAVKNSTLYADSYVDLVAIDVSNLSNIKEVTRVKDIFPYTVPPADNEYRIAEVDKDKGVVINWEVKEVRQEMDYVYYPVYPIFYGFRAETMDLASYSNSGVGGSQGSTFGVGGSMARFGLYGDYLYACDNSKLYMFNVKADATPTSLGSQNVGWQVETMFIYDHYMFFGTTTGMQIFDLKVPTVPNYVSSFSHATSCDPVVIADGYAYITLRGGRTCNNSNINRLDVVKLSTDLKNNTLVASYGMKGPYGLGIDGDVLFLCDGDAGLKVFSVTDKLRVDSNQLAVFPNIKTYDVIPVNGYLFMIGDDGFYLYDYKKLTDIKQIGLIPVVK
ncbi:MAG TPA: hypothetical protein PLW67_02715 [Prolixibacteraceae bacterium]|nr:hypothetical protein [Prolixibacteraceae bacterium]